MAESLAQWVLGWFEQFAALQPSIVGQYTRAFLATQLVFLLTVVLVHVAVYFLVRRRQRDVETLAGKAPWKTQLIHAFSAPAYLALWVYGFHFALAPFHLLFVDSTPPAVLDFLEDNLIQLGLFASLFWLFFRLTRVVENALSSWAGQSSNRVDDLLVPLVGRTLRIIIPVLGIILALPLVGLPPGFDVVLRKLSSLLIIAAVAWILFQGVAMFEQFLLSRYDINVADNLEARRIHTQMRVLKRTLYVIIGVVTVASAMMLFDEVKQLGTSILASAGVAGIILGFAAQRSIANLFAGLQIAISQPIRLDDVVIVENEWGRIEEITLTYVVVRIWDLRRLVVPLSYFIERPFQNWTRTSADLLGTVFLFTDYSVPVDAVRQELQRIVEASENWDGKVCGLQVTNASDRTMELRALASSADASKGWNLRCEVREKLITFLQQKYPGSLPRLRVELDRSGAGPEAEPAS